MSASYAKPSSSDPVSSIKDLKSTIKEVVAETPSNALNQSLAAGNADLQSAANVSKNLLTSAGNESTIQAVTKQAALTQLQNQTQNQNLQNSAFSPSPSQGTQSYSVTASKSTTPNLNAMGQAAIQRQQDEAAAASRAFMDQRNATIALNNQTQAQTQLNAQENASSQAIAALQAQAQKDVAATQAGASIAAAQFGAIGNILGGSGGGSRHQYW